MINKFIQYNLFYILINKAINPNKYEKLDIEKVGKVHVLAVREENQDKFRFLVSTKPKTTPRTILTTYLERPIIEEYHKEIKSVLGFENFYLRTETSNKKKKKDK